MKEKARIISINNGIASLTCPDSKGCKSCAAHGICGGVSDRKFDASFHEKLKLAKGDEVEVFLPTYKTIGAAFMVMIFPLLLFFVFFGISRLIIRIPSEKLSVLFGVFGIAIGFLINFFINRKPKKERLPKIIKKL